MPAERSEHSGGTEGEHEGHSAQQASAKRAVSGGGPRWDVLREQKLGEASAARERREGGCRGWRKKKKDA